MYDSHYIKINDNNEIIKAFSTAFEVAEAGDICVNETGDRHFNLDLRDMKTNEYRLKWVDDEIVEKSPEELDTKMYRDRVIKCQLQQSDAILSRGIEDLSDILIFKNIIEEGEIPSEIKNTLNERKILRGKL